ncbi:MAG: TolC family protein, partial [Cyanobacteriota bacterium]
VGLNILGRPDRRCRVLASGALGVGRWMAAGALLLAPLAAAMPPAQAEPLAQAEPVLRLSLRQALERGRAASLSLRDAGLAVQETRALEGITASQFLPKLDLVGLGTYTQVGTSTGFISNVPTLGDLNLSLGAQGYAVLQNSFGNLGLALNTTLVDFGRGPLRQAARASRRAADAELNEAERRSRFAITSAYLNLQLADAQLPVWQRAIALSSALLRDARAIRRRGLAARIDTLQAEALQAADRQGLAEAEAQRSIARSGPARVLNLAPQQAVEASDPLTPGPGWGLDLPGSIRAALTNRPLLEAINQQRQAQLAQVKAARALGLPRIGLLLGAGYSGDKLAAPVLENTATVGVQGLGSATLPTQSSNASSSGSFYDWGALLTLRQPLFDGGLSRQSADLARRQADRRAVAQQQAEQLITQSVETFWAGHQASLQQRQAAAAAVKAGELAVRDAQLRYRAGIAPITEVLIAQRYLQASRSALAAAIHRWNLSRAGLAMETGLDSPNGR